MMLVYTIYSTQRGRLGQLHFINRDITGRGRARIMTR